MATTAQLLVRVQADASQAISSLGELRSAVSRLSTTGGSSGGALSGVGKSAEESTGIVGKLGEEMNNVGKIALGMATGMAAADLTMGLAERFKQAAEATDKYSTAVLNVQRISGESAENASTLVAIFERFSPSVDDATTRLARFERNLGQIEQGGGKQAQQALSNFGVSVTDSAGHMRSTMDILFELADGFSRSGDAAAKNAALVSLFGRGSQDLLLMLNQGRAGLEAFAAQAKEYGLVLSQENVDDVATFIKAHKEMDLAFQGLSVQIGLIFMPLVTKMAEAFASMAKGLDTTIVPALKRLQDALKPPLDQLGELKQRLDDAVAANKGNVIQLPHPIMSATGLEQVIYGGGSTTKPASAAGGTQSTGEGDDTESTGVSPSIKNATDAVDAAKAHLQDVQYQDDQRKADFDQAHVAAEQEALNLKLGQTEAEQALLAYKRQIEDIDRNSIDYALKRAQLDEQDAVTRAKMAESPLTAQNQDIKYQEDLIKAKLAAAHAGGAPVDVASAHQQLRDLQRQDARMQPDLLAAQHQTTLATRTQQSTDLQAQLENNDTARQKLDVQQAMVPLQDEVAARQRAAEDAQALLDLDKQRFALSEAGYKTELLLAEAAEKAVEHTLFVLQHPELASVPQQYPRHEDQVAVATASPNNPALMNEQPGKTWAESHGMTNSELPGKTWAESNGLPAGSMPPVSVNVGDVHAGPDLGTVVGQVLDVVKQQLMAAWGASLAHSPSGHQLGGAYVSGSNPR